MCDASDPSPEWVPAMKERPVLSGGACRLGKPPSPCKECPERLSFGHMVSSLLYWALCSDAQMEMWSLGLFHFSEPERGCRRPCSLLRGSFSPSLQRPWRPPADHPVSRLPHPRCLGSHASELDLMLNSYPGLPYTLPCVYPTALLTLRHQLCDQGHLPSLFPQGAEANWGPRLCQRQGYSSIHFSSAV